MNRRTSGSSVVAPSGTLQSMSRASCSARSFTAERIIAQENDQRPACDGPYAVAYPEPASSQAAAALAVSSDQTLTATFSRIPVLEALVISHAAPRSPAVGSNAWCKPATTANRTSR
jgi:hypothetical protein